MRHLFPRVVSYSRFVELEKEVAVCLCLFIKDVLLGKCTGISFTDSTALRVCHIKRMHSHRTFSGLAQKGRITMGWFYGFKLHLVINDRGEILNFMITPGNTDDREPQLVTRVRNNMRNMLMRIEHSRHRSFNNFIVNILSAIAAYCFFPKKTRCRCRIC